MRSALSMVVRARAELLLELHSMQREMREWRAEQKIQDRESGSRMANIEQRLEQIVSTPTISPGGPPPAPPHTGDAAAALGASDTQVVIAGAQIQQFSAIAEAGSSDSPSETSPAELDLPAPSPPEGERRRRRKVLSSPATAGERLVAEEDGDVATPIVSGVIIPEPSDCSSVLSAAASIVSAVVAPASPVLSRGSSPVDPDAQSSAV